MCRQKESQVIEKIKSWDKYIDTTDSFNKHGGVFYSQYFIAAESSAKLK
jgi:hypothetical protein